MEEKAIQVLRNDPQMRNAFINRIAAPIANKMFECGMIPEHQWVAFGFSNGKHFCHEKSDVG